MRQLVELHGGSVWASSPGLGQGATFGVLLPTAKQNAPDDRTAAIAQRESKPGSVSKPLAGKQVLVVESSVEIRQFLKTGLEAFGAKVTAVGSACEAMAELQQSRPDVLVSDMTVSGADGCDLIRRIRAMERFEHRELLPAVALTGGIRGRRFGRSAAGGVSEAFVEAGGSQSVGERDRPIGWTDWIRLRRVGFGKCPGDRTPGPRCWNLTVLTTKIIWNN